MNSIGALSRLTVARHTICGSSQRLPDLLDRLHVAHRRIIEIGNNEIRPELAVRPVDRRIRPCRPTGYKVIRLSATITAAQRKATHSKMKATLPILSA